MFGQRLLRASMALALALVVPAAHAATFLVDDARDLVDAVPGDGVCQTSEASCTLRAAVMEANALAGADAVALPPATYQLDRVGAGEDDSLGDLNLTDDIVIQGSGAASTVIEPQNGDAFDDVHLSITVDVEATVRDVTLTGGYRNRTGPGAIDSEGDLTLERVAVTGNSGWFNGAIRSRGTLVIRDSLIESNWSQDLGVTLCTTAGGLTAFGDTLIEGSTFRHNRGCRGGAIELRGAELTIRGSSISENGSRASDGGGLYLYGGTTLIEGSQLLDNLTDPIFGHPNPGSGFPPFWNGGRGGAIYARQGASVEIVRSLIAGNTADVGGGGVYSVGATVELIESTVAGNSAPAVESAGSDEPATGGAVHALGGAIAIVNSTLSGNHAAVGGGAIGLDRASATLTHVTIAENTIGAAEAPEELRVGGSAISNEGGDLTLAGTLVAGSCAGAGGTVSSLGGNLESPGDGCGLDDPADLVSVADPMLGPLAANGGPTPTHALGGGSPAWNAALAATCPATDQRGVARPQAGACDIGALEARAVGCSAAVGTGLAGSPAGAGLVLALGALVARRRMLRGSCTA